jgi:inhibitor of cysteine peptidase
MSGPLRVIAGQAFDVSLEAVPTAGYRWEATIPADATARVNLLGSDWVPERPGLGGTAKQHFHFRALAPGTVVIHFRYSRSWDTVARDEQEVTVSIATEPPAEHV